jgi:hypothetical protein
MRRRKPNLGARNRATLWMALLAGVLLAAAAFAVPSALALPEGRVYEVVSPAYKGGYGVGVLRGVAPNGESAVFDSLGVFAAAPWDSTSNVYVARRDPGSGWSTASLQPPLVDGGATDLSSTLDYSLGEAPSEATKAGAPSTGRIFLLHPTTALDTAANWEVFGGIILKLVDEERGGGGEEGASGDLCHIVVGHSGGPLLPEAAESENELYDLTRGCDGEPSLRLVGVKNELGPHEEPEAINRCPVELGIGLYYQGVGASQEQLSTFNAVSADGREIFFTTNAAQGLQQGSSCNGGSSQLFVRVDGSKTLEVSKSMSESASCGEEVPCPGATGRASAYFKGAYEDGSHVFFTTKAPLVEEDGDAQNDLYMATIGCAEGEPECQSAQKQVTSIVQVSHDPTANQAAEVQGVVRVAADGPRVYFVARGVLGDGANPEGQTPAEGADNLYVYDSDTKDLAFIAELCSGPEESGAGVQDMRCPNDLSAGGYGRNDSSLWSFGSEAQSTPDGRFLVFTSYGRLLKSDTDTAKDVYRYDATAGLLTRVSLGEAGFDSNGNNDGSEATIQVGGIEPGGLVRQEHEMSTRAISEDGSRIVFEATGALSPDAVNGLGNVYEWHMEEGQSEGEVSLISSGSSLTEDSGAVITPSGQDVFFITSQNLVPQDTDGLRDIYDAREGGGFPPAPAPRQPCSGDACQGPLSAAAPLLVPGSVSQAPGQNFAAPVSTTTVKPKPKSKPAKCKKGYVKKKGRCVKKPKKSAKGKK